VLAGIDRSCAADDMADLASGVSNELAVVKDQVSRLEKHIHQFAQDARTA
jgi:hypothetical protein